MLQGRENHWETIATSIKQLEAFMHFIKLSVKNIKKTERDNVFYFYPS